MASESNSVRTPIIAGLFFLLIFLILSCGYVLVAVWPPDCVSGQCGQHTANVFFWAITFDRAENLMLVVAVSGDLGALIHTTSSFADYVGNRQLVTSWTWWLLLRIPVGVALALVFYLLIQGGLIIPNGSTEPQINPYGAAGLAALVGMFAKQATDKLADIFDTLFRSERDKQRSEPLLTSMIPQIRELRPAIIEAGTADVTLRVIGGPFVEGTIIRVNGTDITPLSVSVKEIAVGMPGQIIKTPGRVAVFAVNPSPSGGTSRPEVLIVTERQAR